MVKIIARFQFDKANVAQAKPLFEELVAKSRTDAGCKQYDLLSSVEDEGSLVIVETWASQQDLDVHSAAEHFTRLVPQLAALCVTPPVVERFAQVF